MTTTPFYFNLVLLFYFKLHNLAKQFFTSPKDKFGLLQLVASLWTVHRSYTKMFRFGKRVGAGWTPSRQEPVSNKFLIFFIKHSRLFCVRRSREPISEVYCTFNTKYYNMYYAVWLLMERLSQNVLAWSNLKTESV